ncbi:c-type cytochrome [Psychrobacillus vulpis]|uniref:C-type cytochrome n=1 Tax=Psychrobacillus vulpis TaxID=2325572 RepID=A0A544TKR4_9BACI|nr:c-type cytochrome [Psychrobacillus vulpis]TQR18034.1 c-type cytochrome [Psychrobacillus vulpis]
MKNGIGIAIGLLFIGTIIGAVQLTQKMSVELPEKQVAAVSKSSSNSLTYNPPSLEEVPEGPIGEAITYGYKLVNETYSVADPYVGNNLSCASCHAGAGLDKDSSSLVGVTAVYPQYIARSGKIVTIEDRINGCMVRSMNGEKFEANSDELKAMVAYFTYISEGVPVGADIPWRMTNDMDNVPTPNVASGEQLYQKSCIACHAADGSGTDPNTGPALWGDNSFNDGAGLARISKMAGYIKNNMPAGSEGTLTNQEAADLAAYVLSQDRPEWKNHDKDWPNGGKPNDIMNKERREEVKNGTINWEEVLSKN